MIQLQSAICMLGTAATFDLGTCPRLVHMCSPAERTVLVRKHTREVVYGREMCPQKTTIIFKPRAQEVWFRVLSQLLPMLSASRKQRISAELRFRQPSSPAKHRGIFSLTLDFATAVRYQESKATAGTQTHHAGVLLLVSPLARSMLMVKD